MLILKSNQSATIFVSRTQKCLRIYGHTDRPSVMSVYLLRKCENTQLLSSITLHLITSQHDSTSFQENQNHSHNNTISQRTPSQQVCMFLRRCFKVFRVRYSSFFKAKNYYCMQAAPTTKERKHGYVVSEIQFQKLWWLDQNCLQTSNVWIAAK